MVGGNPYILKRTDTAFQIVDDLRGYQRKVLQTFQTVRLEWLKRWFFYESISKETAHGLPGV